MVTLDWSGPNHWHRRRRPCRLCQKSTNLRDTAGRPAHKVCVETAAARLMAADQRKDESVPGVPGQSDIPTREPYRADNPETRNTRNGHEESPVDYSAVADEQHGAQETTPCCKTGGPLDLQCQLCSKSPTYWRRTKGDEQ